MLVIHQNRGMKTHVLSGTNIDTVVSAGDSPGLGHEGLHPLLFLSCTNINMLVSAGDSPETGHDGSCPP